MSFTIEPDKQLPWLPKYDLSGVIISPYTSAQEYDHHFATTVGSGDIFWGNSEAVRFDEKTHDLVSLWLHVPDRPLAVPENILALLSLPATVGLPRLVPGQSLSVDWPEAVFMNPGGDYIAASIGIASPSQYRLRVAEDFDLVVGERLEGWILHSPAQYLVQDWASPSATSGDKELARLLSRFRYLVCQDFVTRLETSDPAALGELFELEREIESTADTSQRRALAGEVRRMIKLFSDPEDHSR